MNSALLRDTLKKVRSRDVLLTAAVMVLALSIGTKLGDLLISLTPWWIQVPAFIAITLLAALIIVTSERND